MQAPPLSVWLRLQWHNIFAGLNIPFFTFTLQKMGKFLLILSRLLPGLLLPFSDLGSADLPPASQGPSHRPCLSWLGLRAASDFLACCHLQKVPLDSTQVRACPFPPTPEVGLPPSLSLPILQSCETQVWAGGTRNSWGGNGPLQG